MIHLQDLLYRSLDGLLNADEQVQLEQALQDHPELQQERNDLMELRTQLQRWQAAPDPMFADAVMQQVAGMSAGHTGSEAWIFRMMPKVAAASVLLLLVSLLGIYFTEGSLSPEAILLGTDALNPDDAYSLLGWD